MINLESVSGLPIELGDDYHLKFKAPLKPVEPGVRTINELHKVFMDSDSASTRDEMYYMYRKVGLDDGLKMMDQFKVRYDVTVIPPAKIGQELNKTAGHYHANKPGLDLAYPEVYEVLHGHALFLIQKMDPDFKHVLEVFYLEGKPGDKVIYPPNYGHIVVNLGPEPVVMANWVADHFDSDYKDIEDRHGMAYYVTGKGDGRYHFIPNPHYKNIPHALPLQPKNMAGFEIYQRKPMYLLGVSNPQSLEFLTSPEQHQQELNSITA